MRQFYRSYHPSSRDLVTQPWRRGHPNAGSHDDRSGQQLKKILKWCVVRAASRSKGR